MRRSGLSLLVVLVAGCAGPEGGEDIGDDGPVAFVQETPDGGDAALMDATVSFDGDCFLVVDGAGARVLPVFAREQVRLEGDRLLWDGGSFGDGDTIRLGGGGSSAPVTAADHVPAACDYDSGWFVAPVGRRPVTGR